MHKIIALVIVRLGLPLLQPLELLSFYGFVKVISYNNHCSESF